jgi:hypothetical protein
MTPYIERRSLARQSNGIIERVTVRHQRSGGKNALAMGVNDSRIYFRREAEIVGVDNQPLQTI